MKWNEWGFRTSLCTYRLNCARKTSWGWWAERDDIALQTQDLKCEPGDLRPSRLPLGHEGSWNIEYAGYEWAGKRHFVSLKLEGQSGVRARDQGQYVRVHTSGWRHRARSCFLPSSYIVIPWLTQPCCFHCITHIYRLCYSRGA